MEMKNRRKSKRSVPLRYLMLLILVGGILMTIAGTRSVDVLPGSNAVSSSAHTLQDPNQAENYRKLAAAKRKAAERVPEKKDCYEAWARYYDCLADKVEAGDDRDCGAEPDGC